MRASPVGQPPSVRHSARRPGPAARWMAPSTPPPPSRDELAALTMASTFARVMSPCSARMRGTRPPSGEDKPAHSQHDDGDESKANDVGRGEPRFGGNHLQLRKASLARDQEKREGDADGDGEAKKDIEPDEADAQAPGLGDHQTSPGEEQQAKVDGEGLRGRRDLEVVHV